jgi:hypothetical protein
VQDPGNYTLDPTQAITLKPASIKQCGFSFAVGERCGWHLLVLMSRRVACVREYY